MRHRHLSTAALALGIVVLTDVLRVFLPSVITIFGQAATTPAELLGAFALGWFVLALAFPPLVRRLGARPVTLAAAVALGGARLALTAGPGGRTQLWLAAAGLLAGLLWLAGTATTAGRPVPGLALGIALGAVAHASLGTYDLVWRGGPAGWAGSVALVAIFLAATARPAWPAEPGGARAWLLAGPALLLTGLVALSPAVAATASSYRRGPAGGLSWPSAPGDVPTLPAWALGLFLLGALARPPRGHWRLVGPLALVAGAVLFATGEPRLLTPAVVLAAAGTGACLALADAAPPAVASPAASLDAASPAVGVTAGRSSRPALAAVLGMLVFAVAAVAYYAAYDLGYPNAAVPVGVAVLVAAVALGGGHRNTTSAPPRRWAAGIAVASALVVLAATGLPSGVPAPHRPDTPPAAVRLVAYNIRMGYGLDGRFDPDGLARVIAHERPDVVVLGEVDRGWLLNGGHDTLALLAARLRMPYVFAPAADPLWGDAILSRFPVAAARSERLAPVGAPTGAQALGVTVDVGGGVRLAVVATHLQPPPGREPVTQARAVAGFALRYAAGLPLVVAGDLNTEPGAPRYAEFTGAGLVDALASARPLPTSPADDPREQIDHVLVSAGVLAAGAVAPRSTASDHLPVAVTLTLTLP
ncbi:endonuclease/exonuclease/phosphatase family protein [Micromonospora sp. NPDC002575]|uniref:endonuclease/exonuclease/phosphatase family protein n=1 Tax=Micromonospora sp. NPDC002575 TaxID=3364222 RepID=UPI00367F3F33